MSWYYKEYVPMGDRRAAAQKQLERARRKDPDISPVVLEGKKIVTTWWGVAWVKNLESYADYENRIGRGRSYVRNGMVLDLRISRGEIRAMVAGSERTPYRVNIVIDPLPGRKWSAIVERTGHGISNVEDLISGRFPEELRGVFLRQGEGLFPSPGEIHIECSCPDWAYMCKHAAAVLYGIGARLDRDPMMFFTLRGIDCSELIKKSIDEKMNSMLKNAGRKSSRVIDGADLAGLFGLTEL